MVKSRRMKLAGHVTRMGEKKNAYSILVGKPEDKRSLEDRQYANGSEKDRMGWCGLD
jgi:hypothetical protein